MPHCPKCGEPVEEQSPEQITEQLLDEHSGEQVTILVPIVRQKKGTYEKLVEDLGKEGYRRVRIDNHIQRVEDDVKLERYVKHDIDAVQDRITISKKDRSRLAEAVETAVMRSGGFVRVLLKNNEEHLYSTHNACAACGITLDELEPRMFSFNSPFGACQTCHGIGEITQFDEELVVPDVTLSIADGAIDAWGKRMDSWRIKQLARSNKKLDMFKPWEKLTDKQQDFILYGGTGWEGVIHQLDRLYRQTESDRVRAYYEEYMYAHTCPDCDGRRLKDSVLGVLLGDKNIIEVTDLSIGACVEWFKNLELTERQHFIAKQVLKEIDDRLSFLYNVGLQYLTLSRSASTLSGGEAQRIRLATQIGSNLMGVMYILDEPSIGLHQRDNQKLIDTLKGLRDIGNTVIVVEHDEDTIRQADWVIDLGPGAGRHGGKIVAKGTPAQIEKSKGLTGQYLSGKKEIAVPEKLREPKGSITVVGAQGNNLQELTVEFPTHVMCCVTGVSGSGKSTLVNETLQQALRKQLMKAKVIPAPHKKLKLDSDVKKIVVIDQSPIGRTPRSNPATYTKLFDEIRKLFAETRQAKMRGYQPGRFSFNVKGGRCETCAGDGQLKIEMNFLPDVYVECEACKGHRYNKETLEILWKEKNIADVLEMTVDEAAEFFENVPRIARKLTTLQDVGLGYIHLGQSSVTLSGGEAQRIKLTRELAKKFTDHTIYILDEPTTGLHFEDVRKLLKVIQRLVDRENTCIVIEHNLDVIKCADWIIDLGPEGGSGGGTIVATGTPQEVAKTKGSHTGKFLKPLLST